MTTERMDAEPVEPYREIADRLEAVNRRRALFDLWTGLMNAAAASVLIVLAAALAEMALRPGTSGRYAIYLTLLASVAGVFVTFTARPILLLSGVLASPGILKAARFVGNAIPGIRDRLEDAIELVREREKLSVHYSTGLIDEAFVSISDELRDVDFTAVVDETPVRKAAFTAYGLLGALLLVYILAAPAFTGSFLRLANFDRAYAASDALVLTVEPGTVEVVRGQPVSVTVRAEGRTLRNLTLHMRPEGRTDYETVSLSDTSGRIFAYDISAIRATTDYFASAGETESERHRFIVLDRPLVKSFGVTVNPPRYTGLPARELDPNMGDIAALPGSRAEIRISSNKEVASAELLFSDGSVVALKAAGSGAEGNFRVRKNGAYTIRLTDQDGLRNPDPIDYTVKLIPDEYPSITIAAPGKNTDLTTEMRLQLGIRIGDDYGFSTLRLAYRLEHSRYEQPAEAYSYLDIPVGRSAAQGRGVGQDVYYTWDLSRMSLVPEDVIGYYAEVFDNDNVNGPKSARSDGLLVRLPSLEEVLADVDQSAEESQAELQKIAEEAAKLREDLEQLNRDLQKNRDRADWQHQQRAEQMSKQYEEMQKRLQEASSRMEEMVKKAEENHVLSEQTMQKYQELQKLMEKLNSPELREAMKKLQESMKNLSPEQLREAMKQMAQNEEHYRQNLERLVELLKRVHIEQKVDELIKRADEMRRQQDALKERAQRQDQSDKDNLAKEQSDMARQAESLEKESADLGEKMKEFSKEMPVEEMTDASEGLQKDDVPQSMQTSAGEIRSGKMQQASKSQQQSAENLNKFQSKMESVRNQMAEEQKRQVAGELRRQLENLLQLSKDEEDVKKSTEGLDPNSPGFRESAQKQQDVREGLNQVANSMMELSKKSFSISPEMGREVGEAMKQIGEALKNMEQRNPRGSAQSQSQAMSSMNRGALMMQGALEGMMGNEGNMGMAGLLGRLGQMAGQQQGINQGTKGNSVQGSEGQALTDAQMETYNRLASEQGGLSKSVEQLAAEAKDAGEFSKLLGDLDQIAKEMSEVQTDLSQGDVNPETMDRQERILSRLLESQKSMRERDYEKRRTAQSGKEFQRESPAELGQGGAAQKDILREELFNVREGTYSRDYEELIRKYFEKLEAPAPED